MVVGIIIIWEGNVCSRGTEVLTGWLVACLPVHNRNARMESERKREKKRERGRSKGGRGDEEGATKDGMGETRAEEGIQFHCDENE